MEHRSPGFTIIELTIVMIISSFMVMIMFEMTRTITTQALYDEGMMINLEQLSTAQSQFERDFSAMFVPDTVLEKYAKEMRKRNQEAKDGKKAEKQQTPKEPEKKPEKAAVKEEKEEKEPEDSDVIPFEAKLGKEGPDFISFVTSSRLPRYKRMEPMSARVIYGLVRDSDESKKVMHLIRYESGKLDTSFDDCKNGDVVGYRLLENIVKLKVTYVIAVKEKKPKEAEKAKPEEAARQEPPRKLVEQKAWDTEELFTQYGLLIPAYIEFEGTQWNDQRRREIPFHFVFKIYTFDYHREQIGSPSEEALAITSKEGSQGQTQGTQQNEQPTTPPSPQ